MQFSVLFRVGPFAIVVLLSTVAVAQQDPFSRWDKNQDGVLTIDELPEQVRLNFKRVDANGDGSISREEDELFRTRAGTRVNNINIRIPETIEVRRDVPYVDHADDRQKLHLLLPKNRQPEKKLPLLVYIHGGAWQNGSRDSGIGNLVPYVVTGEYAGATIGYRLTDSAQWPQQIYDCKAAIRWLRAHADELGIDPEKIGVFGHSAGGHLVAMLGVAGDVKELEGDLGEADDQSSKVTCVVDFFGPTELLRMNDFESTIDHDAPNSPESKLIGETLQEHPDKAKAASPVTYVTKDDAPMLIFHGTKDPLVPYDQSVRFKQRLDAAGVPVLLVPVTDGGHGGFNNEEDVKLRTKTFFDRHLRGIDGEIFETAIPAPARTN